MLGRIHSIESFGTVDGPGIRFVIFLQGCPMRCLYCHNPDTWDGNRGELISAEELIKQYQKLKEFLRGGGITVSGGEPLMQIDFLIELFTLAKKEGLHTCIDTSGILFPKEAWENPKLRVMAQSCRGSKLLDKYNKLISLTDLVMLDIKHIDALEHSKLTGFSNENVLAFAAYLSEHQVPVWIRYVVVPEFTDDEKSLDRLGYFLAGLNNIKALDVLPYHTMGKEKYAELSLEYPLRDVLPASKAAAIFSRDKILSGMKRYYMKQNIKV